jgi:UDP-glucose 4-epimerase
MRNKIPKILIIGGAGYIGRQIVNLLTKQKKYEICVLDNLSTTKKNYLKKNIIFSKINILNKKKLNNYFSSNKFESVIHLAAKCIVSEGEKYKNKYFTNNILGTQNILDCCKKNKVTNFIFSSSCAVFANKNKIVSENSQKNPISFYGKTKLTCEKMIKKEFNNTNIKFIILRYFNVVGADIKNKIGEFHSKDRLFNNFSKKIIKNKKMHIYGNDYKTKDGTCVRDYMHVYDLANIHIICLKKFHNINKSLYLNCSYGKGYSVLDVAKNFQKLIKNKIKIVFKKRRKGDMEEIVASNIKLNKSIKWKPKYNNIKKMVLSTYSWNKYIFNKTI